MCNFWVKWFLAVICLGTARAFPTLYDAGNQTTTIPGTYLGNEVDYMPVYTVLILNRVIEVKTQTGQFLASFELLMEWEDQTALAAQTAATEKYLNGGSCAKPCVKGVVKDLCCEGVFSVQLGFTNAVSDPDVATSLWVSPGTEETGKVFQSTRVKGTFYQDFKLKNYPYGSLDLGIGMRLYPFVNNEPGSATVLPVPLATRGGSANNGNSAGNGWYVSNLRLKANQPDFLGGIDDYTLMNPLANNAVSWRGAELDEELYREGTYRLGEFVSTMNAYVPTVDFQFTIEKGSTDAFIMTLPLALLSLLNLAVFMAPLFEPRGRVSNSISLFFATTTTMLAQNLGGTNALNAIQRLAVVIFTMLVFTVFSTITWNSLFHYKDGKAQMANNWNLVTGRWRMEKVVLSDDRAHGERDSSPLVGCSGDEECDEERDAKCDKPNAPANQASHLGSHPSVGRPKSFKRRFHEDVEFRRTFCVFADRCCLVATFIVYLVSFCVICTQSSSSTYGTLETLDPILAAQADLAAVDMLRQDWLGSRNGSSS